MCSFRFSPEPIPSSNRPSIRDAAVAAIWATSAGWYRCVGHVTAVETFTRFVTAAIPPSTVQAKGDCAPFRVHGW